MKLGFVSAILHDQSLAQVLGFAAEENFQCVELMCWPVGKAERKFAGVTHIDVNALTNDRIDEVHGLAAHQGIEISGLGYYPNPLDPDPEVSKRAVEHLKRVIIAAEKFGLSQVNTFIGRDWTRSIDDNWPRFLKVWRPIIRLAEDHGVRIGIENCPMYFTADEWPGGKNLAISPAIWHRMFSDISSNSFGLNYDPSHLVWQGMDWLEPLREFREKLFHVHAKDVRILRDRLNQVGIFAHPKEFHQPRIPGFGEIDWAQFIGTLLDVGYDGPVCIEVEDDTFGKTLEGRKRSLKSRATFSKLTSFNMKYTYAELAKMIDHSLLHPTMTDKELEDGCAIAAKYKVASVCIKPYFVKRAVELLKGTGVLVGAVVGFPHGSSATEVKRYETEIACRDGAQEIDMVINIGKALSSDWDYVETDIRRVCDEAHARNGIVKVIFENDFLPNDEIKKKLCEVCERAGADYVKTSTGYGFVKQPDGKYNYKGATEHDLKLMRATCSPKVKVKAAGGVRDLNGLIMVRDLRGDRCGASATVAMLDEYQKRAAQGDLESEKTAATLGSGGY